MNRHYVAPKNVTKNEFLKIIRAGISDQICEALVDSVNSLDDWQWLLNQYVSLLEHSEFVVRRTTLICIGHLARLNPEADKIRFRKVLTPLLDDSELRGTVENAIDDVEMFLRS